VERLRANPYSVHQYAPPAPVVYAELDKELFVGEVYVRVFNEAGDAEAPLPDEEGFLRAVVAAMTDPKYYAHMQLAVVDDIGEMPADAPASPSGSRAAAASVTHLESHLTHLNYTMYYLTSHETSSVS
jgi:hypothetical protein